MKELSIFIDESGSFGTPVALPEYYIVTMVFHDQTNNISNDINIFEKSLIDSGFNIDYIHTSPIIRGNDIFNVYSLDERRKMLYKTLNFYMHCNIKHSSIIIDRKEAFDVVELSGKLAKQLSKLIKENINYFESFDKVIVYYDFGQSGISALLNATFSILLDNVEFRKALQSDYRLLQVADFISYIELLRIKKSANVLGTFEKKFFYKPQELNKVFIKAIDKKNINKK